MIRDAQGHHLSGATEAAVTVYDEAAQAFNLVHGDAVGLFDARWRISEKPGCLPSPMIPA
jgi:hypothetical protein